MLPGGTVTFLFSDIEGSTRLAARLGERYVEALADHQRLLNLLSVDAAYGLLGLVFQHGVGAGVLGFQQVESIDAGLPLFPFAVLFGLSMDYQVFLLSRIKERHDLLGEMAQAVASNTVGSSKEVSG